MAEPTGEFSMKMTGHSEEAISSGTRLTSYWEGTATGFGTVFGTLTVDLSHDDIAATSGTCRYVAVAYLADGGRDAGAAEGTWTQHAGHNAWTLQLTGTTASGQKIRSESEIDLAARSWTGKNFDAS